MQCFFIYTLKTKGDIEYNNNYDVAKKYEIENEIDKDGKIKPIKMTFEGVKASPFK